MGRKLTVALVVAALGSMAAGCAPPDPGPSPIGPNERFAGRVNGEGDGAVIRTVCAGPSATGRPAAGQSFSVVRDPHGAGDTGSHSSTVFAQTESSYPVVQLTHYGVGEEIPTWLEVPCDGKGTIRFLQCFGIIACLDGSPDVVEVRFENLAL